MAKVLIFSVYFVLVSPFHFFTRPLVYRKNLWTNSFAFELYRSKLAQHLRGIMLRWKDVLFKAVLSFFPAVDPLSCRLLLSGWLAVRKSTADDSARIRNSKRYLATSVFFVYPSVYSSQCLFYTFFFFFFNFLPPPHRPFSRFSVEVAKCDAKSTRLTSTDSSFSINGKGEIKAVSFVPVSESGRTFSVRAQDSSGLNSEMEVHLVRTAALEEQVELLK